MDVIRTQRRLTVLLCFAALAAYAGGVGWGQPGVVLTALALAVALLWVPGPRAGVFLERALLAAALVLVSIAAVSLAGGARERDLVVPIVHLLLLLLAGEALKADPARSEARLYALSFALLLAGTAYRPGPVFAAAFAVYVLLATAALSIGTVRRRGQRLGAEPDRITVPLRPVIAVGVATTLAFSMALFLTFPRVSRAFTGYGTRGVLVVAGFGDEVTLGLHGSRIHGNAARVLRVEFPDGAPAAPAEIYWRGRSYDRFDGVRWSRSPELPPSAPASEWYRLRWPGPVVQHEIFAEPLQVPVLFTPHPVLGIRPRGPIQPIFDAAGDVGYSGRALPVYTTRSLAGRPSAEQLRAATGVHHPAGRYYLQLPRLSGAILALADSLSGSGGTRHDRVVATERWLRSEFGYTRDLPRTPYEATLDGFLFQRREGHCEYFSTAMVVLLRTMGIPARNVTGFLGGTWNEYGGFLDVTQNEAHSWVEVWFPSHGWVPFEPTPPGGVTGVAASGAGRLRGLFAALDHRWGKWVLDYGPNLQIELLRGARRAFDGPPGSQGRDADRERDLLLLLLVLGVVLTAAVLLRGAARRDSRRHPASRGYLRLRRLYDRHGVEIPRRVGPLTFLDRLAAAGAPALPDARRVVERYVRVRYGGAPWTASDPGRLAEDLRAIRRALRRARRQVGRSRPGGDGDGSGGSRAVF